MLKSVREKTWPVEGRREASTVEAIRAALVERLAMGNLCCVGMGAVPPLAAGLLVGALVGTVGVEVEVVPPGTIGLLLVLVPVPKADADEDEDEDDEGPLEGGEVEVRVGMGVAVPVTPPTPTPAGAGVDPPMTIPPVWLE